MVKTLPVKILIAVLTLGGAGTAAAHHTATAHADTTTPAAAKAPATKSPAAAIAGRWRGTSLCVDLTIAPGCHDEQVLYTFTPVKAVPDSVSLNADKLVNGTWASMGTIELRYDTASHEWRSEFRARNGTHGRWWFVVQGDSLKGGLLDLPSRAPIREVRTRRTP